MGNDRTGGRSGTQAQAVKPRSRFSASPAPQAPASSPAVNPHRAALEALFAPKMPPTPEAAKRDSAKMVTGRAERVDDPREADRQKLLTKLLAAEGRAAVTKAAEALVRAGFGFPEEQEVHLQLLEHGSEARVCEALLALTRLMEHEAPRRRTVLDARLRRLEDGAEEPETRELTSSLRRKLARVR